MARPGKTFSESWHRVADLRVSLRPTVRVRKQLFRGERWYVLHDPFNNQFFRLRPEAHDFVSHLRPDRTVEEVWDESLDRDPDEAPGQEDVIQLLTQLYFANLLYFETPADSSKLFERYKKRRQREIRSKLLSIMFVRVPLFDPENLLRRLAPMIKYLVSPAFALLWLLVVIAAAKLVLDRFNEATDQMQGILAPDNLLLLYAGLVVIKTLHEFGHAMVCKRFGGEVHTMGVMLLVFTPIPYMDATSSWSFRSRWHRMLVGAAGMITEVFVAALATFLWAYSGPGTLHSLAYNMMFIASVSTVLFNGNPLLRFDGYYILSDLLDIPNLATRARGHLRHLAERYLFGYKESHSPTNTLKEATWLSIFGVLSAIYRVVVFTGIIFFVADKFLLAGLLMALICVISWGVVPLFRFTAYLGSSPRLTRTRPRAIAVSAGTTLVLVTLLAIIPFPNRFRAPGVVEAKQYLRIVNDAPGYVEKVLVPSGTDVRQGTSLIKLSNRELELEIDATMAQRKETLALKMRAMSQEVADLEPIQKRLETIESKLKNLLEQKSSLVVKAGLSGTWVAPRSKEMVGAWIPRGSPVGEIVNDGAFRFSAMVSQNEAADLFVDQIKKAEVRLYGQGERNLEVKAFEIVPFQHEKLPSAALGWFGGGEVAVSTTDETGLQAAEPFFQIYANLILDPAVTLFHGRSGKLRFTLPPKPLLFQWGHKFLQLLQRRYQI
jgi:putative peptide zinc metalloprotease protein